MQIFPSKLEAETITVTWNFLGVIPFGETISVAQVVASAISGEDTSPQFIVSGSTTISGYDTKQKIIAGRVGVTYKLTCQITTNTGGVYTQIAALSVIDNFGGIFRFGPDFYIDGELPDAAQGQLYNQALDIVGGNAPYSGLRLVSGSFPPWALMTIVGSQVVFNGFVDRPDTYTFTIEVKDFAGMTTQSTQTLSTINLPFEYNALTYVGTGAASLDLNMNVNLSSGGMLWRKNYTGTGDHIIEYSLDGVTVKWQTFNDIALGGISSTVFNSQGAVVTTENSNGQTYGAFALRKGAGFTVIEYTGNGANRVINHDLGTVPEVMLIKVGGGNWSIYHKDLGNGSIISSFGSISTSSTLFQNTTPTSTTITLGTSGQTNPNGFGCTAFLFSSVVDARYFIGAPNVAAAPTYAQTQTMPWRPLWIMNFGGGRINEASFTDRYRNNWGYATAPNSSARTVQTVGRTRDYCTSGDDLWATGTAAGQYFNGGINYLLAFRDHTQPTPLANFSSYEARTNPAGALEVILSNNNRTVWSAGSVRGIRSYKGRKSGKYYWEAQLFAAGAFPNAQVGIAGSFDGLGSDGNNNRWAYYTDGRLQTPTGLLAYWDAWGTVRPVVIRVAVDLDANKIWFGRGLTWNGVPGVSGEAATFTDGVYYAFLETVPTDQFTCAFTAADAFTGAPDGFTFWDD